MLCSPVLDTWFYCILKSWKQQRFRNDSERTLKSLATWPWVLQVNTTREGIRGVKTIGNTQLIFLDVPGTAPLWKKLKDWKGKRDSTSNVINGIRHPDHLAEICIYERFYEFLWISEPLGHCVSICVNSELTLPGSSLPTSGSLAES